jgi:hypothetical protein
MWIEIQINNCLTSPYRDVDPKKKKKKAKKKGGRGKKENTSTSYGSLATIDGLMIVLPLAIIQAHHPLFKKEDLKHTRLGRMETYESDQEFIRIQLVCLSCTRHG